jgi:hypothetical protein
MFTCFSESLFEFLQTVRPSETVTVWYSLKSKEYNEKWYTNAYLMHMERGKSKPKPEDKKEDKPNNDIFTSLGWDDDQDEP